jgi:hypothetical protein
MTDFDAFDRLDTRRRRLLQAGTGAAAVGLPPGTALLSAQAQRVIRLEALQRSEDRGVSRQESARRSADEVPQGIRGPDGGGGVLSILAYIFSWNNFVFGAVLAGPATRTLPAAVYTVLTFEQMAWGPPAARPASCRCRCGC